MIDPKNPVLVDLVAGTILNARGMRRGAPTITNVLEFAPEKIVEDARDDARQVLEALAESLAPSLDRQATERAEIEKRLQDLRTVFYGLSNAYAFGSNPEDCMRRANAFMESLTSEAGVEAAAEKLRQSDEFKDAMAFLNGVAADAEKRRQSSSPKGETDV